MSFPQALWELFQCLVWKLFHVQQQVCWKWKWWKPQVVFAWSKSRSQSGNFNFVLFCALFQFTGGQSWPEAVHGQGHHTERGCQVNLQLASLYYVQPNVNSEWPWITDWHSPLIPSFTIWYFELNPIWIQSDNPHNGHSRAGRWVWTWPPPCNVNQHRFGRGKQQRIIFILFPLFIWHRCSTIGLRLLMSRSA